MTTCKDDHRFQPTFATLPRDQGSAGRHHCAGCAYERGLVTGLARAEIMFLDLDSLPESQAGTVRHRSPHAAWAMGYADGIRRSYKTKAKSTQVGKKARKAKARKT